MSFLFSGSLMRTTILTAAMAAIPALAIVAGTGMERGARVLTQTRNNAHTLIYSVAQKQEIITEGARTLLATLARMDSKDAARMDMADFLNQLDEVHPAYADIFMVNEKGVVTAGKRSVHKKVSVTDRLYFSRAMQSNSFAAGEIVFSRLAGEAVFPFAHKAGALGEASSSMLAVGIRLSYYNMLLQELKLPEGAELYIADMKGDAAFALPPVNGNTIPAEISNSVAQRREDAGDAYVGTGKEQKRIFFRRLRVQDDAPPYVQIFLAMPEKAVHAKADSQMRQDLLLLVLSFAATIAFGAILVRVSFTSSLKQLMAAAQNLAYGRYTEFSAPKTHYRELNALGNSLANMAATLSEKEHDLITARRDIEAADKIKSEFLANMSHEIRTPMNAIIGMAYLTLKTNLTARQRGYVGKIHDAGTKLLQIINDILELSKIDAGKLGTENVNFSLRDLLSDIRRHFSKMARAKGLEFSLNISSDVPAHFVGDPLRVSQVIGYLLDNAVRYTEHGKVALLCDLAEYAENSVVLRVKVEDTGHGIPAEQAEALRRRIADESLHLPEKGVSGLGLLLAQRIVRLMNGDLSFESSEHGSSFMFTVRLGTHRKHRTDAVGILSGIRALAVDDDTMTLTLIKGLLEGFGMRVDTEVYPQTTLAKLRLADAVEDPYRLVILDWRMPVLDGIELTKHIKQQKELSRMPDIIMLSSFGWGGVSLQAEQAGVDAFLHKPINESVMLDTVMTLLAPRLQKNVAETQKNGPAEPEFTGLRVLLAEDNAVNQQIAREILADAGISVTTVDDGKAAVELLSGHPDAAPFDIVLMDLQMPVMDGFEATRILRGIEAPWARRLPVIAMTAHGKESIAHVPLEAGFVDHVGKPILMAEFFAVLRRWLPVTPVQSPAEARRIAELVAEWQTDSPETPAAFALVEGLLERCLHDGRMRLLRELVHEGRLHDAADFLIEHGVELHFMNKG